MFAHPPADELRAVKRDAAGQPYRVAGLLRRRGAKEVRVPVTG
jgi:hypothetical protein